MPGAILEELNPRCAEAYARCAKVEHVHDLGQAADLDARQALKLLTNPSSAKDFSLRCIASAACTELSHDPAKYVVIQPTIKIGSINWHTAPHIGIRLHRKALLERQKAMARAQSKTARDFLALGQLNDDDYNSEALLNFDKALKCNPKSAIAWANRAKALWTQNDIKRALDSCNRAIQLDKQIDCYYERALLRSDLTGAIADMKTDYAFNRDAWTSDIVRFSLLAQMEKADGNIDGAISELSKRLAVESDDFYREQRADLLLRQNRLTEARKDYDQVICMTNSSSRTRLSRAALRFRTGDICGFWQDVSRAIWK